MNCFNCGRPLGQRGWRWANGRRTCINQYFCYRAAEKR